MDDSSSQYSSNNSSTTNNPRPSTASIDVSYVYSYFVIAIVL